MMLQAGYILEIRWYGIHYKLYYIRVSFGDSRAMMGYVYLQEINSHHGLIATCADHPFWSVSVIDSLEEYTDSIHGPGGGFIVFICFHHSIFKWCWSLQFPFPISGINWNPSAKTMFCTSKSLSLPRSAKRPKEMRSRPLVRGHVGRHRRNQELPENSGPAGAEGKLFWHFMGN